MAPPDRVHHRFTVWAGSRVELAIAAWSPAVVEAVRSPATVTLSNATVTGA